MPFVVDRTGSLSNKRRTATGGYLVDAVLARVGTLDYLDGKGGIVRHYNPPEVLEAALPGLLTAPVTNRHPSRMVDTESYRDVAAGHVVGTPTLRDGKVHATLAIQDADLISDIELGVAREVSLGYMAHSDDEAGEYEGQKYHKVRRMVEPNHIAIVPAGRAGKVACLSLDSNDIPNEEDTVMKLKIKGKEVAADAAQAVIDALEAQFDALEAKLEVAKAKLVELESATTDAAIDAKVAAKLAEKTKAEEKAALKARVAKAYPKLTLDGKPDAYIEGLAATLDDEEKDLGKLKGTNDAAEEAEDEEEEVEDAAPLYGKAKMLAELRKVQIVAE